MRGEYLLQSHFAKINVELPPRARRIPAPITFCENQCGTTSACAENTGAPPMSVRAMRNYLRVRGEYAMRTTGAQPLWELPPRARRILVRKKQKGHHHGTTSACAENTSREIFRHPWCRNYLRVRGEYHATHPRTQRNGELPPRARRIPSTGLLNTVKLGTTSACAENTVTPAPNSRAKRNYLRVRGEYSMGWRGSRCTRELPPRARRILVVFAHFVAELGTTSACAENTGYRRGSPEPPRNYLRVRGEYPK